MPKFKKLCISFLLITPPNLNHCRWDNDLLCNPPMGSSFDPQNISWSYYKSGILPQACFFGQVYPYSVFQIHSKLLLNYSIEYSRSFRSQWYYIQLCTY